MNLFDELEAKCRQNPRRLVFPEGNELKIIQAARIVTDKGIADPILIGDTIIIKGLAEENGISLSGIEILDKPDDTKAEELFTQYEKESGYFPKEYMLEKFKTNLFYGAMLVHMNAADAMVAGLIASTSDVIMASQMIIGLKDNIQTASSLFIMDIPGFKGSEGQYIIFADCGVVPNPDEYELADIAISTAATAKKLLGWDPRVAMLSFSTDGSAENELVTKVTDALALVKERDNELKIDGEFQLDSAIVPDIAAKKVKHESAVAGKANILIFPDLNAGNITYKAVQRFAGANAYGPFLQGFAKSVSDLSRGSSVEDIVGVSILALANI